MGNTYKTPTLRSANVVNANPQRLESADKKRWACGRNVKGESPRGRGHYEIVEVWALKGRGSDGAVYTVATHCDRKLAEKWVKNPNAALTELGKTPA